jgi:hypothetical protein
MKDNSDSNNARLSALLRAARPAPALPPRFQENVWRRIEAAPAPAAAHWLERLAAWILRPRHALATAALLLLAGVMLGAHEGSLAVRQDAQARYLANFMLDSLR